MRLLGLLRILQCHYVPNCWFVTHIYAYLARCVNSKTRAYPKTNPFSDCYTLRRRLISNLRTCPIDYEVGLDFYVRAERASINYNFQAINIHHITLHIFPVIT